jgi:preprotein translocase subunit SecD
MSEGFIRATRNGKAGSSGLFCCALLTLVLLAPAAVAEPLTVEGTFVVASALDERTKAPIVSLKLPQASARLFAEFTSKNVGRKMEIRVGGKAVIATVIREPILGGSLQISDGSWTIGKVRELAELLDGSGKIEFEVLPE